MASHAATPTEPQGDLRQAQGSTEPTLEHACQTPDTQATPVDPAEELQRQLLRTRFATTDSSPQAKFLCDIALPSDFDDLFNRNFKPMVEGSFLYPHGQLTCADVTPIEPASSHYFQVHRENFNSYDDYIKHCLGQLLQRLRS